MAREKKDGSFLSVYLQSDLVNRVRQYAKENDMTLTAVLERALKLFFESK